MKLTPLLLSVILAVFLYGCMVTDHYLYYIEKGDKMIERMDTSSAIIQCSSDEISVYKEIIEGESGDYINVHTQYYDKHKRLVAYKRVSSFFNSYCYDGILKEVTLYSIHHEIPKIEKHTIYREDGSIFKDTLNCTFPYRFEYKLFNIYPADTTY